MLLAIKVFGAELLDVLVMSVGALLDVIAAADMNLLYMVLMFFDPCFSLLLPYIVHDALLLSVFFHKHHMIFSLFIVITSPHCYSFSKLRVLVGDSYLPIESILLVLKLS